MVLFNFIQYLKDKYNLENGFFCIYGSYATGTQNSNSDVDLLYIYRSSESKLKRTSENYNNIPISFYELSTKDLYDDANGKYGGFFCGKIFNPNILIDNMEEDDLIIQKSIATFFANIFSKKWVRSKQYFTSDEILKNSIRLYIELYPEYFAYLIRLIKNDSFIYIWNNWKKSHIAMLLNENVIKLEDEGYYYINDISDKEFDSVKMDYISRFWIYGAVSHNSNLSFYDYYKNKNKKYILEHEEIKKKAENYLGISYSR